MARRAVICSTNEDLTEIRELVDSLGYVVTDEVLQHRDRPDARTFLGKGKVAALAEAFASGATKAELVVVAGDLRPSQVLALESELERPVYDRIRLILEIFKDRASNEEAKLQVELARLHYELPVLREAIHRAKTGERAGFLAGGATAFATQVEPVRTRMSKIRKELDRIRAERGLRRQHRKREGYWQVSLAGYTNAGKSTLLNAFTEAHVLTEDRVFSTLETRTRRLHGPNSKSRVLLTDTVGFIEDLPPWLIEAFHATLEEIAFADLVLLVLDGAEPVEEMHRKVTTSLEVLRGFLAERGRPDLVDNLFLVFNKADAAPALRDFGALADRWGFPERHAVISAATGDGIEELTARMRAAIPDRRVLDLELPSSGETFALLDRIAQIGELETIDAQDPVAARVAVPQAHVDRVIEEAETLGGKAAAA